MLIECIGTPINIDGKPILKDFRLNVAPNRQLRIKMNYLLEGSELPVDIVVFNYSLPKLDKLSLGISIDGKEMNQKVSFSVWLGFSFFDRKWTLRGTVGVTPVKYELSTFLEIIQVIKDLAAPYRPVIKN